MDLTHTSSTHNEPEQQLSDTVRDAPIVDAAVRWITLIDTEVSNHVSAQTAYTLPWLWQGLTLIATDVASTSLRLVRVDSTTRAYRDILDDPRWDILSRMATPYISAFALRQTLTAHALLYGNAIAVIERLGSRPVALHPVHPTSVMIYTDTETGAPEYEIFLLTGERLLLPASEVLHLRNFTADGIVGEGVLHHASLSLGGAVDALTMRRSQYRSGALPQVVLKPLRELPPEKKSELRASWEAVHAGPSPRSRVAVLPAGIELDKIPRDLQGLGLESLRDDILIEIAAWLGVPVGILSNAAKDDDSTVHKRYVTRTLYGWYERWESELNAKLLSQKERDIRWRHDREEILLRDPDIRWKKYEVGMKNLWFSPNEIRKSEHLAPYPGGDAFLNPNTTPGASTSASTTQTTRDADARLVAIWRAWIDDVSGRLASWEQDRFSRLSRQGKITHISDIEAIYAKLPWESGPLRAVGTILNQQGCSTHPMEVCHEYARRRLADLAEELAQCTDNDDVVSAISQYEWHRRAKEIFYDLLGLADTINQKS